MSTLSVTTNLLLLCLRGGFPTIGIVSFGPGRSRPSAGFLGTVPFVESKPVESLSGIVAVLPDFEGTSND
jgi:hypothetical protein